MTSETRRAILIILSACVAAESHAAAEPRPNILFIFTDDQSHRSVSCYDEAHPWVRTPNIDRLAVEGMRFEHATMGTWCMASRAQLLTGRHPHGIGYLPSPENRVRIFSWY